MVRRAGREPPRIAPRLGSDVVIAPRGDAPVAAGAEQAQVGERIRAAICLGLDVVNVCSGSDNPLRLAPLAQAAVTLDHDLPKTLPRGAVSALRRRLCLLPRHFCCTLTIRLRSSMRPAAVVIRQTMV
jgi:hypothetical protein